MSTDKRRVAAYLPANVEKAFLDFKIQRGLATEDNPKQNDSQALIQVLSEFLEVSQLVSQPIAHLSNFVTLERFEDLEDRVASLSEKLEVLLRHPDLPKRELLADASESHPGQLNLLAEDGSQKYAAADISDDSPHNLSSELTLSPLRAKDLNERMKLSKGAVGSAKFKYKDDLSKLTDWLRQRDPDGIAWEYDPVDTLFHPIEPDF